MPRPKQYLKIDGVAIALLFLIRTETLLPGGEGGRRPDEGDFVTFPPHPSPLPQGEGIDSVHKGSSILA